MKPLLFSFFACLLFVNNSFAQEKEDSTFTKNVLDQRHDVQFRFAVGRQLQSGEFDTSLGITQKQKEAFEAMLVAYRAEKKTIFEKRAIARINDEIRSLDQAYVDANANVRGNLLALLTIEQRKRFSQVVFQKRIPNSGSVQMYLHPYVQSYVQLDDAQKAKLRDSIDKLDEEYQKEFAELNEKYRQQVLQGVSKQTREKVDTVVGEIWYRFPPPAKSVLLNKTEDRK